MPTQQTPRYKTTLQKPFDLTTMLSVQYATRLTPTPNHILFENPIGQRLKSLGEEAANTNNAFTQ
jgi:hypothetical protein